MNIASISVPNSAEVGASQPASEATAAIPVTPPDGTAATSEAGSGAPAAAAETPAEFDKLGRAKAAAERARNDAARRRARLEQEAQRGRELETLRSERDGLSKRQADLEIASDASRPLEERGAAMRRLGLAPAEIARMAVREGTPEATLEATLDKRLGPLMTELQELRQWRDQEQARASSRQRAELAQGFEKLAGDETRFPTLSKQPLRIITAAAAQVWANIPPEKRAGVADADVLEYLEEEYAAHAKRAASTAASPRAGESPTASTPNDSAGSATPRTVTQDTAPPRMAPPPNWDAMSIEEQKAWMVETLRAARGKSDSKK